MRRRTASRGVRAVNESVVSGWLWGLNGRWRPSPPKRSRSTLMTSWERGRQAPILRVADNPRRARPTLPRKPFGSGSPIEQRFPTVIFSCRASSNAVSGPSRRGSSPTCRQTSQVRTLLFSRSIWRLFFPGWHGSERTPPPVHPAVDSRQHLHCLKHTGSIYRGQLVAMEKRISHLFIEPFYKRPQLWLHTL